MATAVNINFLYKLYLFHNPEEVNRERSFFKYIWEHKQIERTMQAQSLSLGMILLQPDMKQLLNVSVCLLFTKFVEIYHLLCFLIFIENLPKILSFMG